MPRVTVGTVVKIVIICFVVGLALTFLNVDPATLLEDLVNLGRDAIDWTVSFFAWAIDYILLGAVIVLPIWLAVYLIRMFRGRR